MKLKLFIVVSFLLIGTMLAQDSTQTFLALGPTGVENFHKAYPKYDGRGTIVFVLDTGIDMGIDGLTKTTTGKVKVIDVQDFTGEGDISFYPADVDNDDSVYYFVNEDKNFKINGANKLSFKAVDDNYFIGDLPEKLWMNSGSHVKDVNGNGKTNDNFYFVTFKTEKNGRQFWVIYVDTNDNGTLSDEKPLQNYKVNYDTFHIATKDGLPAFTIAVNIFPDEKRISFFFDDGGHGTNCAGIATGNRIGDSDFYGVAPGANLIGLKLGNNNLAGGATVTESMKKAFDYYATYAAKSDKPCIVNMSFGIGSEIEGRSEIEKYLEKITKKNPYLYICNSNGNEGPGISTTGLPASTPAVFSSGAVLNKLVASDEYGAIIKHDLILHFSSRGGEVFKPDVVSPGASASTIPNFMSGDRMWGTSMASPYSAGVMSLLLSAAKQEFPKVKIPAQFLYTVLRQSATHLKGYDALDQGGGYINVMNAYKLLKKYIKQKQIKKFETYTTSSFAPNMPDAKAPALYIRDGSYLTGNETYTFSISRNNTINKKKFYRICNIKSSADWLKPIQRKIHFRNSQDAQISVMFDKTKMKTPGLYNGVIYATRANRTHFPEFKVMATVVIPYQFNNENNYSLYKADVKVGVGELNRYFIKVPAGGKTLTINLSSDRNSYAQVWYFLNKPAGPQIGTAFLNSDKNSDSVEKKYFNLKPGVYELDVMGYYRGRAESTYNLSVHFDGISRIDNNNLSKNNNNIQIINYYNETKAYNVSGAIDSYTQEFSAGLKGGEHYKIPFTIKKGEKSKEFNVKMSKENFNKVTDFALMIYNEDGKALSVGGLSYDEGSVRIRNNFKADSTNLTFVMIPGFTFKSDSMKVNVIEKTVLSKTKKFMVTHNKESRISFYPSVITTLQCDFSKPGFNIPRAAEFEGKIKFYGRQNKELQYLLPVVFNF